MRLRIAGFCIVLLSLIAGSAMAQWQQAYYQELPYDFRAVHFPTSSVGYIVGSGGAIFKSTDGGYTWTQQTSPTTNALYSVFFTDANNGFAVGASGTIIYTTDGTNWSLHPQSGILTTAALDQICFVGSNGWMAGGPDNNPCQIFSTTDGGTTWANNVVTNPSTDMCTGISFANANVGFASLDGNGIMYTTDGGANWTKSTVNLGPYSYTRTDIECIKALDASHAVAAGWGSLIGLQPTIVLYSNDGGVTFNNPDPNYPWATYAYGYGVANVGNNEVMIVGGGSQSAAVNLHSVDGGATWSRYPTFFGDYLYDACLVPGTSRVVAVGSAGCIALSNDRGLTWTHLYDPGSAFQGIGDFADMGAEKIYASVVGSALLYFDVLNGTHTYMMASPENWGPTQCVDIDLVLNPAAPPPGGWDESYNDVLYLSGNCKYLVKSRDYGKTWTELSHTASLYDGILDMYWFHPDTAFLVGHVLEPGTTTRRDETIWKTVDGGQTLQVVLSGTLPGTVSLQWNGIDFAPGNRLIGAVVGDDNYIMHTTDGGASWSLATENIGTSTLDLEDVVFVNSTTAFAVGDNGILVKTTDGGASWFVQTVPWGTVNLLDIHADTPNRLWVAGADQLLYYTVDGGATWTNANVTGMPTTYDVRAVYFQGAAGRLWAGCDYSNVFYRTDAVAGTETPKSLPFILNQNFPNPFNPSTTIEFSLAADDHVSLAVYDAAGRLVATVMDRDLSAGDYRVAFRADGLTSGVYFYRLSTSRGDETRKMILLR